MCMFIISFYFLKLINKLCQYLQHITHENKRDLCIYPIYLHYATKFFSHFGELRKSARLFLGRNIFDCIFLTLNRNF